MSELAIPAFCSLSDGQCRIARNRCAVRMEAMGLSIAEIKDSLLALGLISNAG